MKKLGEMLVEKGLITKDQLEWALKEQKKSNARLGKILTKNDFLSEEQLLTFLAKQYNVYMFTENELTISKDILDSFNYDVIFKYGVIPFKKTDKGYYIGFSDLSLLSDIDEISFNVGKKVVPVLFPDSMHEKILSDLKAGKHNGKDYKFESFEKKVGKKINDGLSLEDFFSAVLSFEPGVSKIFLSEGSEPALKKTGRFYKLNTRQFSRKQILEFIKYLTDEPSRKRLLSNNYLKMYKVIIGKAFIVNILKQKEKYLLVFAIAGDTIPEFEDLGFKKDIAKYILEPTKGLYLFVGPYGHGKSTVMASIVNYFNTKNSKNILYVEKKNSYEISSDKSMVTQVDMSFAVNDPDNFFQFVYDLEPDIVFLSDISSLGMLDMVLKLVESGRTVYASYEEGSISGSLEKIFMLENNHGTKYYTHKLANSLMMAVNLRLITVENINRKMLIYEYVYNSFKLKKALMESNFRYIDTQLRGTADYMPFEKTLADLYKKNSIDFDTAETYAVNFDLFKNYAGIKGE